MSLLTCAHDGWGQYPGETGPCPPAAEMTEIDGGRECPTCGSRIRVFTGPDALERAQTAPRTAVLDPQIERR